MVCLASLLACHCQVGEMSCCHIGSRTELPPTAGDFLPCLASPNQCSKAQRFFYPSLLFSSFLYLTPSQPKTARGQRWGNFLSISQLIDRHKGLFAWLVWSCLGCCRCHCRLVISFCLPRLSLSLPLSSLPSPLPSLISSNHHHRPR